MASWRLAASLAVVFREVNAIAPNRNRASDGTIGNAAHMTRSSDHNAWVRDGLTGVVRARDITHHPGVFDAHIFADQMRVKARGGHPAFGNGAYIISNRRIASAVTGWQWKPYSGDNPHTMHAHFSVGLAKSSYDSLASWTVGAMPTVPVAYITSSEVNVAAIPVIKRGSKGQAVRNLQGLLNAHGVAMKIDGDYGPGTEAAVKAKQAAWGMKADGAVGPATWTALIRG